MSKQDDDKIVTQYVDVDPKEAEWDSQERALGHLTRRVILHNGVGARTGLQVSLISGIMEDIGLASREYSVTHSPFDMNDLWSRGQEDKELELIGVSVYLTEHGWAEIQKVIQAANHPDFRHTFETVTFVQTRNDLK